MTANRVMEQLPLVIMQTTKREKYLMWRFSVLSAIVHAVAFGILMAWTGGRARTVPPVQVITVDLSHMVLPRQQTLPRQVQQRPVAPVEPVKTAPIPARVPVRVSVRVPAVTKPHPLTSSGAETPTSIPVPANAGAAGSQSPSSVTPATTTAGLTAGKPRAAGPAVPALPHVSAGREAAGSADIRVSYMQRCRELIERHKEYPVMARKGRTEGTVVIRGTLARDGSLRECLINRSSGSGLLDNAALRAIRSVSQFPPVPPELQGGNLVFELPISFRLSTE